MGVGIKEKHLPARNQDAGTGPCLTVENMKEFFRAPAYYEHFRCTASKCTDSCCIGWEIDIDEETAGLFGELIEEKDEVDGAAKKVIEKLQTCINWDAEPPHYILDEGERCPFLNENNLCEMILGIGEDCLCQICNDHPRYFEWYSNGTEAGVGMCCEEAAGLILTAEDDLVTKEYENAECDTALNAELNAELRVELAEENELFKIRDSLFKDINYESCSEKEALDYIEFLQTLEINDEEWAGVLRSLRERMGEIIAEKAMFEKLQPQAVLGYRKIVRYFIYRYFAKVMLEYGEELGEAVIAFAQYSASVIELLDVMKWNENGRTDISIKERIDNCKIYSKEIEYCEENVEAVLDKLSK